MFSPKCLLAYLLLTVGLSCVTCDYYTSVSGLEKLLEAEGHLLESLNDFLKPDKVSGDVNFLKKIEQMRNEHAEAKNNSFEYLSNPISAFKLIKRFVADWTAIEEYFNTEAKTGDLAMNLTKLMKTGFLPPSEDDLKGASLGIVRLQNTYALNVTDMSEGKIYGVKYGSSMTDSDCFELGMSLYQAKEYKHALPWLQRALDKSKQNFLARDESAADILRFLSATYFHLGNPKMALLLTNELLKIDPTNEDILENKRTYEDAAFVERNSRKLFRQPFTPQNKSEPTVDELYEMTCRGENRCTPTEERNLRCLFTTNGLPWRAINPFKVEQISLDPQILYYHQVITDTQIELAIKEAEPIIERSQVGDLESWVSEVRTSKTGWLYFDKHEFLNDVAITLTEITGLSLETAEALQIVNYGIGGHYAHHWDFSDEPTKAYGEWRGNRILTALFYLNNVELGGATAFPFLKVAVPPVKGSLVMWWNLHESLEQDYRMKHAACPVLKGSKWILNEWYHERGQEFLRPCSLHQMAFISEKYRTMV